MRGWAFASVCGTSGEMSPITRDNIADNALLSPELLFPDLNVFATEMPYDSQRL